ncbi:TauD/TfdA family dioxygenase [Thiomonas sp.]|uniref:TauD/TfdA family dioxygenase n=1 Tax=Thiomonas sp. TaxID=2047785 RepID=UPI00262CF90C|nr:TauD/TfdA family dioxygenase [Thiomonas sp.]
MSSISCSLSVPTLEVRAESVRRALHAARAEPQSLVAQPVPLRIVQQAAREAIRELGAAPRPELAERACLVRFDPEAWPVLDFHRCVLTCVAAHWLGAGHAFGLFELGQGVFQPVEPGCRASAVARGAAESGFHTELAALRPAFQPELVSLSCCSNRVRGSVGVVDAAEVFEALPAALREVAQQERFCHGVDPALGAACHGSSEPRSLVRRLQHGVLACADLALTRPARAGDASALRVLQEIDAAARDRAVWLQLQPGDVLFLRNHRVLHAARAPHGAWQALRVYWRQSLIALGNFAGTTSPGMFSAERALRPHGR